MGYSSAWQPEKMADSSSKDQLNTSVRQGFLLGGRGKETEQRSQGWGNESSLHGSQLSLFQ